MSEVESFHDVVEDEVHFKRKMFPEWKVKLLPPDHVKRHGRHNQGVGNKV